MQDWCYWDSPASPRSNLYEVWDIGLKLGGFVVHSYKLDHCLDFSLEYFSEGFDLHEATVNQMVGSILIGLHELSE